MSRYVLLAFRCLGASISRADELPGGATVEFGRLYIHQDNGTALVEPSTDEDRDRYFNLAHCTCSQSHKAQPIALSRSAAPFPIPSACHRPNATAP